MRMLTTLNLATWAAAAVLFFAPSGIAQFESFAYPHKNRVPEPSSVIADLRNELRDSRASVIRANDVTYERDTDEFGVLLPNPPDAVKTNTLGDWSSTAK